MTTTAPCPWCTLKPGFYTTVPHKENSVVVPCGYCRGTATYAAWTEHPEYLRQRADPKLRGKHLVWP